MANSALDSGICRGEANEMGSSLCDDPRQTGAAIAEGSIPSSASALLRADEHGYLLQSYPVVETLPAAVQS